MPEIERRGTGGSAVGLLIIAASVIALIAVVAWAFMQPGFFDEVVNIAAIVLVALVVVLIVSYIVFGVLAVAMYASKGEIVQKGVDHSLEDIRGVEGRTLDDDGNDIRKDE